MREREGGSVESPLAVLGLCCATSAKSCAAWEGSPAHCPCHVDLCTRTVCARARGHGSPAPSPVPPSHAGAPDLIATHPTCA